MLFPGALGQTIKHELTSTCAVRGSTATLPCSFTPLKSFSRDGPEAPLKNIRVRWCKNHLMCQDSTSSVFDSNSTNNNPRYQYLGDLKGNCSLQIRDVEMGDDATFYFRVEADEVEGSVLNTTGVKLTVVAKMSLNINEEGFRSGRFALLRCILSCSASQHNRVTWKKDGVVLSQTWSNLLFNPLTVKHSGSYTCALRNDTETQSEPFVLQVEAADNKTCPNNISVGFAAYLVINRVYLTSSLVKSNVLNGQNQIFSNLDLCVNDEKTLGEIWTSRLWYVVSHSSFSLYTQHTSQRNVRKRIRATEKKTRLTNFEILFQFSMGKKSEF
uniref:Ig-like domain-containing protein n=1 Tax=Cyprinodon variegatus TaxID=28743 RepID=A0A3Q2D5J0_CYPVA